MKVALYYPHSLPESFRVCANNIAQELALLGTEIIRFADLDAIPAKADAVWDPRAGGGNAPIMKLCKQGLPLVVTLHGAAPMAIPLKQYYRNVSERYRGWLANRRKIAAWRRLSGHYAAVVTVSESSRDSILAALPIGPDSISWCHNAVDHSLFRPASSPALPVRSDYLLHISNDEPRKNVDRLCEAYLALPEQGRPRLILKLPQGSAHRSRQGIEVISERLDDQALLSLYQNALAFVFPSLFEGFGLPIVEAMASGCPVITSTTHACAEVAGDAALLVDPESTRSLTLAMQSICDQPELHKQLRASGLERAQYFQWRNAAKHYQSVFDSLVNHANP